MSYNITHTNGEELYPGEGLPENTTDTIIYSDGRIGKGIVMIGKLVAEYGTDQSNNFLRLLENFSNPNRPDKPQTGMLWFNSLEKTLNICTDSSRQEWTRILVIKESNDTSSANNGDLYYDSILKELQIYDDELKKWITVGPVNYAHRSVNEMVLKTSRHNNGMNQALFRLPDDNDSYLTTVKIVAREKVSRYYESQHQTTRIPETASWICTALIERYTKKDENNSIVESYIKIIGNPNYQTIAKSEGLASNWEVYVDVDESTNDKMIVNVIGLGTNEDVLEEDDHVEWEIEVEYLKV